MKISDPTSKSEDKLLQIIRFVFKRHIYCWPGWNGLYSPDTEIVWTGKPRRRRSLHQQESSDSVGSVGSVKRKYSIGSQSRSCDCLQFLECVKFVKVTKPPKTIYFLKQSYILLKWRIGSTIHLKSTPKMPIWNLELNLGLKFWK